MSTKRGEAEPAFEKRGKSQAGQHTHMSWFALSRTYHSCGKLQNNRSALLSFLVELEVVTTFCLFDDVAVALFLSYSLRWTLQITLFSLSPSFHILSCFFRWIISSPFVLTSSWDKHQERKKKKTVWISSIKSTSVTKTTNKQTSQAQLKVSILINLNLLK